MTIHLLLIFSGAMLVLLMLAGVLLLHDLRFGDALAARIRAIHGETPATEATAQSQTETVRGIVTDVVSAVGTMLLRSGLIPAGTRTELELMLSSSGLRGTQGLNVFLGCKIFSPIVMALLGWVLTANVEKLSGLNMIVLPILGVVGLLMPDWIVSKRRKRYLARVEQGLPDALDMMVICTQAGLGLGSAVVRVAEELAHSYRDLAMEFAQTANELQIMTDGRQALINLGSRTGIDSFKRFATTLVQTMQYGTPIAEALRALSTELRQEMLTRFEERAARLPVIITMPMIVFILPCVFIIAAGPALMQVSKAFGQ